MQGARVMVFALFQLGRIIILLFHLCFIPKPRNWRIKFIWRDNLIRGNLRPKILEGATYTIWTRMAFRWHSLFNKNFIIKSLFYHVQSVAYFSFQDLLCLDQALLDTFRGASEVMNDHVHEELWLLKLFLKLYHLLLLNFPVHLSLIFFPAVRVCKRSLKSMLVFTWLINARVRVLK